MESFLEEETSNVRPKGSAENGRRRGTQGTERKLKAEPEV